ncbi:MAG: hypothetical protein MR487_07370 [Lachnospiraceae bacterium]|nr:hypothetical protein [Lachnospiraceae bacterium]
MKQLFGLVLFSFGAGMALMIFLPENFWVVLMISVILIIGFNLFCH